MDNVIIIISDNWDILLGKNVYILKQRISSNKWISQPIATYCPIPQIPKQPDLAELFDLDYNHLILVTGQLIDEKKHKNCPLLNYSSSHVCCSPKISNVVNLNWDILANSQIRNSAYSIIYLDSKVVLDEDENDSLQVHELDKKTLQIKKSYLFKYDNINNIFANIINIWKNPRYNDIFD